MPKLADWSGYAHSAIAHSGTDCVIKHTEAEMHKIAKNQPDLF